MLDNLLKGNFKEFKDSVVSSLYSKIASRLEDAKSEIASGVFGEEKESDDVEYKERINHADVGGYPEEKDGKDDEKGGEFLVHVKMLDVPNTELKDFRVVGASKEDVESRLNNFFGKGKFEIKNMKLSEERGEEYKEKDWQKEAEKKKAEKKEKDEAQSKKQDTKSIWYKSEEKNESTVAEGCGGDVGKPGLNFQKIAKKAGAEYGSAEAGKRVAGSILKKILKKKVSEERIDELKASTLGSYIGKSKKSEDRSEDALDKEYEKYPKKALDQGKVDRLDKNIKKRSEGRHSAMDKLRSGDYQTEEVEIANKPEEMAFNGYLKKIGLKAKKANTGPKDVDDAVKETGKVKQVKQLESVNNLQAIAKVAQSVEECSTYTGDYDYKNGDKDKEYSTSHDSFSDAIEHAKKHALSSGYKHDPVEFDEIVNQGFIKPNEKKTHAFHVSLQHKGTGKEAVNKIHNFQITGHGDSKFNLTQDIK